MKVTIVGLLILLFFAIIGVTNSYSVLRWDVFGASIFLALLSVSTRRYYWCITFVSFALLFNPWMRPSLSRNEWVFADILLFSVLSFWFFDYFQAYRKGLLFEHFIQNKFAEPMYILVSATKDLHKKLCRFVESDTNPDFVFREKATGKVFAVECKYRSDYVTGNRGDEGIWWKKEQGERYQYYSQQNNIPVYIAIGVGGNPKNPRQVGLVPIDIIQKQYYKFIPKKL
ncbi:MAG: hypothetical protein HZB10_03800 [Candidatus Yonathbacteria bacterium]|nr:hypothetical protein [Candidatus Yonathbacteria bacterium]